MVTVGIDATVSLKLIMKTLRLGTRSKIYVMTSKVLRQAG